MKSNNHHHTALEALAARASTCVIAAGQACGRYMSIGTSVHAQGEQQ